VAKAYLGIGSNIGNRKKNIRKSINLIKNKCKIIKISSIYKTEPIGYKNQNWFINCVIKIETKLTPEELLIFLKNTELKLKRIKKIKNGPRTIDLDILFYKNSIINKYNLIIPHPRAHERLFVLTPLKEISPKLIHPILRKNITNIIKGVKDGQVFKL